MKRLLLPLLVACTLAGVSRACDIKLNPHRTVTFISPSDCHSRIAENRRNNDWDRETLEELNRCAGLSWPASLGGGCVQRPRGVVVLGDAIDDGDRVVNGRNWSEEQYRFFVADFGLDGSDGFLKFPVFEGWGNHDGPPVGAEKGGFSFQANLQKRNALR